MPSDNSSLDLDQKLSSYMSNSPPIKHRSSEEPVVKNGPGLFTARHQSARAPLALQSASASLEMKVHGGHASWADSRWNFRLEWRMTEYRTSIFWDTLQRVKTNYLELDLCISHHPKGGKPITWVQGRQAAASGKNISENKKNDESNRDDMNALPRPFFSTFP